MNVVMRRLYRTGSHRLVSPVYSNSCRYMCAESTTTPQLPPNLQLADLGVLEPPPEDVVPPIEYLFPPKNCPTSIPVQTFQDAQAETTETAPLDKRVFGVAIRQDIIHQIVRYQRAKIRQPQCTKGISELRGSTRKLYAQKGGGRARVGMARVPGRRGGAKAHGPVLRDFSFSLNRKMRAMGMMIALAAKFREGNLIVFDKLECETLKTKALTQILDQHGLLTNLTLFIDNEFQKNFESATRNLSHATTLLQNRANVYDIVKNEKLVITTEALASLQERLVSQRYHVGKKKALVESLAEFDRLRLMGESMD